MKVYGVRPTKNKFDKLMMDCFIILFKLDRGFISQCRVGPLPVVKNFDVLENGLPCFLPSIEIVVMNQFRFQRSHETLHRRIVPAIAFATHRSTNAILEQQTAIAPTGILPPSVRPICRALLPLICSRRTASCRNSAL